MKTINYPTIPMDLTKFAPSGVGSKFPQDLPKEFQYMNPGDKAWIGDLSEDIDLIPCIILEKEGDSARYEQISEELMV